MSKQRKKIPLRANSRSGTRTGTHTPPKVPDLLIALLLALFGFVLYANTLGHGYVLDDALAISINTNVQQGFAGIIDIFRQPYRDLCFGGCLYRPLTLSIFAIEWALRPDNPFIGHLMNVLWYCATLILLFMTLRRILPGNHILLPIIAVLLFTAHPIHTEVVANIKSRDEILSLFFVILSLNRYVRWFETKNWKHLVIAGIGFLAALLSKEGAISAIAIFPLIGWTFFQKSFVDSIRQSAWTLVPVGIFLLLRGFALDGLTEPVVSMMDNPIIDANGTELIGTAFVILFKYFLLLLLPLKLISDYSYNVVPLYSLGTLTSLAGLLLYTAIAAYAVYGLIKRRISGFIAAAFLTSILLYSQVPKVIGTMMAERFLYTQSLWFILGLTAILSVFLKESDNKSSQLKKKKLISGQRNVMIACVVILVLYSFQTIRRNAEWKSNFTLYEADVAKAPNSIRLLDGYAEELYKSTYDQSLTENEIDQRLVISEQYSRKSLSLKPGVSAYNTMGNINFTRKNFSEAITYYQKTLDILKNYDAANRNIIFTLMVWATDEAEKHNNTSHAIELLQQALLYDKNNVEVWHRLGVYYTAQRNYTEALKSFEMVYKLAPATPGIKEELKSTYLNLGMKAEADVLN